MRRFLTAAIFFGLLTLAWQLAASSGRWSPLLVPSPASVVRYLGASLADGTLGHAALVTGKRLFLGYGLGLAIGLPLGFLNARFRLFADTFGVLGLGLQTLPSVCWVPLALLWFGQSESAMLFVTVTGTLWSISIATEHGVRAVPPLFVRAAQTMGSRSWHTLTRVTLPAALPAVLAGMKQGWAFAWRSLMAAEIYVTILSGMGLGNLLHYGRELHAMDQVLGVMLVIVSIGLLTDLALFTPIEHYLRRRWGLAR